MAKLLAKIVANRGHSVRGTLLPSDDNLDYERSVIDEVREIIDLPDATRYKQKMIEEPTDADLDPQVAKELREYVSCVAALYRNNDFHNFEHVSFIRGLDM